MSELALNLIRENIAAHERGEDAGTLDLGNCGMTEVPEEIGECDWLETLILTHSWNQYDIERKKFYWEESRNSGEPNTLARLPSGLSRLKQLNKLIFNNTQISTLAPVAGLAQLQFLHFSYTNIADLTPLAGLENLEVLHCTNTPVADLTPLGKLDKLRQLHCNNTLIVDLKPISGLNNVHILHCSNTEVSDLSALSNFQNLRLLHCAHTQISDLKPLAGLAKLQLVHCYNSQVVDLSPLAELYELQSLHCYNSSIVDLTPIAGLTNIQSLQCYNTEIADLEPLVGLKNLQQLHFYNTQVADLSPIAGLTNLLQLMCFNTAITDLKPLSGLAKLQQLHLYNTQVSDLSPIAGLHNLQQLYCYNTKVSDLSPIANLKKLFHLYCYNTKVSDLSPVAGLVNLQSLYFYNTPVSDLRPIAGLTNLQQLFCFKSQVTDIRPILPLIKKGINVTLNGFVSKTGIDLQNCPLVHPPIEIVKHGNQAIINYFAELDAIGEEKSLEAKLLLIGEGMSGKTSLRTRLLKGEHAPLPPRDERTRGLEVEVEPYYVDQPGGERLRLNIFDFGGQKHYKPLHQFFYSHRSLYVLVTKNGDDSNEFDFWFDTAQLFGGGSPVLVVNNLFGDVPSGFSRSKYARFDAILRDSLDTNLDTSTGFSAVKKRIGQIAEELPHVHQNIPKTWASVRRALEKLRNRNIIPVQEYLELCAQGDNGHMDRDRALFCSAYLHDIGACLHYQQFPFLKRYVIVRNEWATEAVYRVMDDGEVGRKNGHFNMADLDRIWQRRKEDVELQENFRYEEYQPELLELMRRFKLCFPLKSGEDFVAPHLLPTKQDTDLRWQPENDLQFEVEYDFMPPGLFSRFVVSRYEDIGGENRNHVWSDEVFFVWEDAEANVRVPSRAGKKAIVFRVKGRDPIARRLLLTDLLRDLKKLHEETPGIVAEERIPCICEVCRDAIEPTFYPYSKLKSRQDNDKKTIECDKPPFSEVKIGELLGNIFIDYGATDDASDGIPREIIENLLALDDLQEALEVLKKTGKDDAVMYLARFRRSRSDLAAGIIGKEEHEKVVAVLRKAALDLLDY